MLDEERDRDIRALVETGGRFASHGAWPLAVIHMTREEWEPARPLLSRALSSFLERSERYEGRRLLARVKVAQGIAEALVMDYARLPRARDLLIDGLGEGARVPDPLLAPMLEALDAHEEELSGEVLTAVLDRQGPAVLRLLHDTAAAWATPAVARHLEARADAAEVRPAERAAALRQALPILLAATPPQVDRARSALDRLEGWARDGVQDIEARFEAWTAEYGEPEEPSLSPTHPYRILVVGGDERQHELRERVARAPSTSNTSRPDGAATGPGPSTTRCGPPSRPTPWSCSPTCAPSSAGHSGPRSTARGCPAPGGEPCQVARMVRKAAGFAARQRPFRAP